VKKASLSLLLSLALTGTALGQMYNPGAKKKKAAADDKAKTEAAKPADPATTLPKDFDPKIATDARATDARPREKAPAATPADKKAKAASDVLEIGKTQLAMGNLKEALEYLDKAVSLAPKNEEARILRGEARVKRKMYAEAVTDLNFANKTVKDNATLYFWRGRAKQEMDKDKEAVVDLTKAIELKADFADAYYWRGFSYGEMDQLKDNACPDYIKAAQMGNELASKAQKKYCK